MHGSEGEKTMEKLIVSLLLLFIPLLAFADQRTTDFCLQYLKEELQSKVDSKPFKDYILTPYKGDIKFQVISSVRYNPARFYNETVNN